LHLSDKVFLFFSREHQKMGCLASSPAKVVHDSEIEARIVRILSDRAKAAQDTSRKPSAGGTPGLHSFEQFVVSFGSIKKNFLKIKEVFDQFDDNKNGLIELDELNKVLKALGAECSNSEIEDIFTTSARSGRKSNADSAEQAALTFKEFLVCIAVGYLLGMIPEATVRRMSGGSTEVKDQTAKATEAAAAVLAADGDVAVSSLVLAKRKQANDPTAAFKKVVDAFLYFDKNGDGVIEKDEMKAILSEDKSGDSSRRKGSGSKRKGSNSGSMAQQFLSGERWAEIDWDRDGKITFKEFLLAVSGWVGLGEAGEERDD